MYALRPYQVEAVEAVARVLDAGGRPLVTAPTGSGKSVIQAEIVRQYLEKHPDARVLCAVHTRELVQQNAEKIRNLLGVPVGIVHGSAKQLGRQITCATVNTMYRKVAWLKLGVGLIVIDECHRVPKRTGAGKHTMYAKLLDAAEEGNPNLAVVGMTATPFRMKSMLVEPPGNVFTQQAYEISIKALIDEGYLSMLKTTYGDESDIEKRLAQLKMGGHNVFGEKDYDLSELSKFMRDDARLGGHVDQIVRLFKDRKCWLVFAVDIDHTKALAKALLDKGINADYVTGSCPAGRRNSRIMAFREGRLRALVNCQILTTGFDVPSIDALAMVRATQSRTLYVQIAGRGMRIAPGKADCAYLDFGGNVNRFGPINNMVRIKPPKPRSAKIVLPPSQGGQGGPRTIPGSIAGREEVIELRPDQWQVLGWRAGEWDGRMHIVFDTHLGARTLDLSFGPAYRRDARSKSARLWRYMHAHEGVIQPPASAKEAMERFHELDMPDVVRVRGQKVLDVHFVD